MFNTVFKLGLLLLAILYKDFDFFNLGCDLHHAQVSDLLGSLNCSPLQIFPKFNDDRMETHGEQQLSFKLILDFHNDEAMLLSNTLLEC